MAITAAPYGQFLLDLGLGNVHDLLDDTQYICLLTPSYTPDMVAHKLYSDISASECAPAADYTAGGTSLLNKTWTYNAASATAILTADAVTAWNSITCTTHYAAIYRGDSIPANQKLLALINFGADRTYNGEAFQLSFSNGVITLGG